MDTTKRIEIAARLLANMIPELFRANTESRAHYARQALDWVDALEEVAVGDRTVEMTTPEYPWDTAPEWANWAATDEDGEAWWFEDMPKLGTRVWLKESEGLAFSHPTKEGCPNWRNTLQPRPKAPHA